MLAIHVLDEIVVLLVAAQRKQLLLQCVVPTSTALTFITFLLAVRYGTFIR